MTLYGSFFDSDKEITDSTFEKFKQASVKYEKGHPSSVGLEGFDAKVLNPAEFREIVKRTFNLKLTPPELAAAMSIFDNEKNGYIKSAEFLVVFFKLGVDEKARIKSEALESQKSAEDMMAAEAKAKMLEDDAKHKYKPDYDFTGNPITIVLFYLAYCHLK